MNIYNLKTIEVTLVVWRHFCLSFYSAEVTFPKICQHSWHILYQLPLPWITLFSIVNTFTPAFSFLILDLIYDCCVPIDVTFIFPLYNYNLFKFHTKRYGEMFSTSIEPSKKWAPSSGGEEKDRYKYDFTFTDYWSTLNSTQFNSTQLSEEW